ncbi:hypothetical protein BGZ94_006981 [Podila epigama]|nr:hypothetical protein BGZ94_006981 [Podila epigama]
MSAAAFFIHLNNNIAPQCDDEPLTSGLLARNNKPTSLLDDEVPWLESWLPLLSLQASAGNTCDKRDTQGTGPPTRVQKPPRAVVQLKSSNRSSDLQLFKSQSTKETAPHGQNNIVKANKINIENKGIIIQRDKSAADDAEKWPKTWNLQTANTPPLLPLLSGWPDLNTPVFKKSTPATLSSPSEPKPEDHTASPAPFEVVDNKSRQNFEIKEATPTKYKITAGNVDRLGATHHNITAINDVNASTNNRENEQRATVLARTRIINSIYKLQLMEKVLLRSKVIGMLAKSRAHETNLATTTTASSSAFINRFCILQIVSIVEPRTVFKVDLLNLEQVQERWPEDDAIEELLARLHVLLDRLLKDPSIVKVCT